MGIQGLLPTLKSIVDHLDLTAYRGLTVGVDASVWLHKALFTCATQLALGQPTEAYVRYCDSMVSLMTSAGITPYVVFDGGYLPMKLDTETQRRSEREKAMAAGLEAHRRGDASVAHGWFTKAVDVTPSMAADFIRVLRRRSIPFVVAPYEADAQLAFLARTGLVQAVITEDSDLLPFGAPRVMFKLDKSTGRGQEIRLANLRSCEDLSFLHWNDDMFLSMCILAGCDYLPSLPGLGVKKAHDFVRRHKTTQRILTMLKFEHAATMPADYPARFARARLTFLHQRVWDPRPGSEGLVTLTPLPEDFARAALSTSAAAAGAPGGAAAIPLPSSSSPAFAHSGASASSSASTASLTTGDALRGFDWDFIGPWLDAPTARGIAEGWLDPITKAPFEATAAQAASALASQRPLNGGGGGGGGASAAAASSFSGGSASSASSLGGGSFPLMASGTAAVKKAAGSTVSAAATGALRPLQQQQRTLASVWGQPAAGSGSAVASSAPRLSGASTSGAPASAALSSGTTASFGLASAQTAASVPLAGSSGISSSIGSSVSISDGTHASASSEVRSSFFGAPAPQARAAPFAIAAAFALQPPVFAAPTPASDVSAGTGDAATVTSKAKPATLPQGAGQPALDRGRAAIRVSYGAPGEAAAAMAAVASAAAAELDVSGASDATEAGEGAESNGPSNFDLYGDSSPVLRRLAEKSASPASSVGAAEGSSDSSRRVSCGSQSAQQQQQSQGEAEDVFHVTSRGSQVLSLAPRPHRMLADAEADAESARERRLGGGLADAVSAPFSSSSLPVSPAPAPAPSRTPKPRESAEVVAARALAIARGQTPASSVAHRSVPKFKVPKNNAPKRALPALAAGAGPDAKRARASSGAGAAVGGSGGGASLDAVALGDGGFASGYGTGDAQRRSSDSSPHDGGVPQQAPASAEPASAASASAPDPATSRFGILGGGASTKGRLGMVASTPAVVASVVHRAQAGVGQSRAVGRALQPLQRLPQLQLHSAAPGSALGAVSRAYGSYSDSGSGRDSVAPESPVRGSRGLSAGSAVAAVAAPLDFDRIASAAIASAVAYRGVAGGLQQSRHSTGTMHAGAASAPPASAVYRGVSSSGKENRASGLHAEGVRGGVDRNWDGAGDQDENTAQRSGYRCHRVSSSGGDYPVVPDGDVRSVYGGGDGARIDFFQPLEAERPPTAAPQWAGPSGVQHTSGNVGSHVASGGGTHLGLRFSHSAQPPAPRFASAEDTDEVEEDSDEGPAAFLQRGLPARPANPFARALAQDDGCEAGLGHSMSGSPVSGVPRHGGDASGAGFQAFRLRGGVPAKL